MEGRLGMVDHAGGLSIQPIFIFESVSDFYCYMAMKANGMIRQQLLLQILTTALGRISCEEFST